MNSFLKIIIIGFLIGGCANDSMQLKQDNKKPNTINDKTLYKGIYNNLHNNLDGADEQYINLKTTYENSRYLSKAASILAIAHMNKKEYILANFYIQELLQYDSSSKIGKFLLSKNQFLYAQLTQSDQQYINSAIKSLQTNLALLSDSEHKMLSNSMLTRLKFDKIYNYAKIGSMYKKLNKNKAYELYINKSLNSEIDINSIYKP